LLGSAIGKRVLDLVDSGSISHIWTDDHQIAAKAVDAGIRLHGTFETPCHEAAPAVAMSVHFPRILNERVLASYDFALNLHPGLLPFGRGWYPVFWALLDEEPAGATLHLMTNAVDGGPVVDQTEVPYTRTDTGASLHDRVQEAEIELFHRWWPRIATGERPPSRPQRPGGSFHSKRDFEQRRSLSDLDAISAEELVRLARCLTFPGFPGLIVDIGGVKQELDWRLLTPPADTMTSG
jgi:methionyl-tRNA formyltransferase